VVAFWNVVYLKLSIFAKSIRFPFQNVNNDKLVYVTNNNKQNAQNTTEFHTKTLLLPTACKVGGKLNTKTAETTKKQRKKTTKRKY